MTFKEALKKLSSLEDLNAAEAAGVMRIILEGKASQAQIGAFLLALHMKGETAEEISAFARVMRDTALIVKPGGCLSIPVVPGGTVPRRSISAQPQPLLRQEPAVPLSNTATGV
jgi:anthranilate phosphoribosyltransferase